ncbi:MAG: hypothetical protein HZA01_15635 [Nitrospinae bacterium]|nr:hypothetical protein [Nitrospinota bacterium]
MNKKIISLNLTGLAFRELKMIARLLDKYAEVQKDFQADVKAVFDPATKLVYLENGKGNKVLLKGDKLSKFSYYAQKTETKN